MSPVFPEQDPAGHPSPFVHFCWIVREIPCAATVFAITKVVVLQQVFGSIFGPFGERVQDSANADIRLLRSNGLQRIEFQLEQW